MSFPPESAAFRPMPSEYARRSSEAMLAPHEHEPGLQELVTKGAQAFRTQFDRKPALFSKGSARVEVVGNFTDQGYGLRALGFATNLGIIAATAERMDRTVRIWSDIDPTAPPQEIDLDNVPQPQNTDNWANYPVSILNRLKEELGAGKFAGLKGADIALVANVPPGTAISTSAAVEAAFTHSFLSLNNETLDEDPTQHERKLVMLTKKAENEIGSGCGILDQGVSNTTVARYHGVALQFTDPGDGIEYIAEPVYMDVEAHGAQFAVIFAKGVSRNLAGTDYGRKAELIQAGSRQLAVLSGKAIDELTEEDAERNYARIAAGNEEMAKATLHVLSDNTRVVHTEDLLNKLSGTQPFTEESESILVEVGHILDDSARSSIDNYGVPTGLPDIMPTFDPLLEALRETGALGARNEGGGGIPTSIALVRTNQMQEFTKAVPARLHDLYPEQKFEVIPVFVGGPSRILQMAT